MRIHLFNACVQTFHADSDCVTEACAFAPFSNDGNGSMQQAVLQSSSFPDNVKYPALCPELSSRLRTTLAPSTHRLEEKIKLEYIGSEMGERECGTGTSFIPLRLAAAGCVHKRIPEVGRGPGAANSSYANHHQSKGARFANMTYCPWRHSLQMPDADAEESHRHDRPRTLCVGARKSTRKKETFLLPSKQQQQRCRSSFGTQGGKPVEGKSIHTIPWVFVPPCVPRVYSKVQPGRSGCRVFPLLSVDAGK